MKGIRSFAFILIVYNLIKCIWIEIGINCTTADNFNVCRKYTVWIFDPNLINSFGYLINSREIQNVFLGF